MSTFVPPSLTLADTIVGLDVHDVRFPTSRERDGSDAMNPFPDYSAAYLTLRTSGGDEGYALVFTVGRGNELQVGAIKALEPLLLGSSVDDALANTSSVSRSLTGDGQLRWLGPDKGPIHMAAGAVVNALWDLASRRAGKPLWMLLSELSPEQIVNLVDFRYLRDALTENEALAILEAAVAGRGSRTAELLSSGHPAYTTTPGWLGYDDEKLVRLCKQAVADGFTFIKLKIGADLDEDVRRLGLARQAVGRDIALAVDANQIWGVPEARLWIAKLAEFDPYWIEEPTSPDDVLGHAAIRTAVSPIRIATGEHVANAVLFKQLLQAGSLDVVQIDACRVAGVNENVAILLLAAKFGVPVCPHAGGVGLCEMVQHLAMFDFVSVGASWSGRYAEYVDHLHEHFVDPVEIAHGRYVAPLSPGSGARMTPETVTEFTYPHGPAWRDEPAMSTVAALDAHVHLWQPDVLNYPWLLGSELHRRFDAADLEHATDPGLQFIVVQAECTPLQAADELRWIEEQSRTNAGIVGFVAFAPLEQGADVRPLLRRLEQAPLVVGVRRLIQDQALDFTRRPELLAGLHALGEYGLPFDICAREHQLGEVIELVRRAPEVTFVLDHLGKPQLARESGTWRQDIARLASSPNVMCKLSGLAAETSGLELSLELAAPFLQHALGEFGPDRCLFGSDWPVLTAAATYRGWQLIVGEIVDTAGSHARADVFGGTARRVYGVLDREPASEVAS